MYRVAIYILLSILFVTIYFNLDILSYALLTLLLVAIFKILNRDKKTLHVDKKDDLKIYLDAFENSGIYAKLDAKSNILYANRQFCQIMYATKERLQKLKFSSFLKSGYEEIYETVKYGQTWEGSKVFVTFNREEINLNSTFIPIFDKIKER